MPYLTKDTPNGNTVRRVLDIPEEYISEVTGALFELTLPWNWEQSGTQTPDDTARLMTTMMEAFYVSVVTSDINGKLFQIPVWNPSAAPNGWVFTQDTSYADGYYDRTSPAQNQSVSFSVPLNAGTWQVEALYTGRSAAGIITFAMDGVNFGTLDQYHAALSKNVVGVSPSVIIASGGFHVLRLTWSTKNGNSSGYEGRIQELYMRQTA